jgi:alpha-mannosidase
MILSAIKQAEDAQGLIVRLWNPLEDAQAFTLETA